MGLIAQQPRRLWRGGSILLMRSERGPDQHVVLVASQRVTFQDGDVAEEKIPQRPERCLGGTYRVPISNCPNDQAPFAQIAGAALSPLWPLQLWLEDFREVFAD